MRVRTYAVTLAVALLPRLVAAQGSPVADALRGKGIGCELMGAAEARAVERGCHSAWVDTFSFQAPGFYRKLGYQVFGELDYPPGHRRIFLQKRLATA